MQNYNIKKLQPYKKYFHVVIYVNRIVDDVNFKQQNKLLGNFKIHFKPQK